MTTRQIYKIVDVSCFFKKLQVADLFENDDIRPSRYVTVFPTDRFHRSLISDEEQAWISGVWQTEAFPQGPTGTL